MRVVLDSNILLVAIGRLSKYRPIWDAFTNGYYQLVISDEVVYEYEEILQQFAAPNVATLVLEIFLESPQIINQNVYYQWNAIIKDPDDNKFFDIAVAANVDYLVTNDSHFNVVKDLKFPRINILSADEFLLLITSH